MGEHDALGCASGARGIDDGGEVVGLDRAGEGFGLGIKGGRALRHELIHEQRSLQLVAGNLDVIHDHDLLDLGLGKNRLDFAEL